MKPVSRATSTSGMPSPDHASWRAPPARGSGTRAAAARAAAWNARIEAEATDPDARDQLVERDVVGPVLEENGSRLPHRVGLRRSRVRAGERASRERSVSSRSTTCAMRVWRSSAVRRSRAPRAGAGSSPSRSRRGSPARRASAPRPGAAELPRRLRATRLGRRRTARAAARARRCLQTLHVHLAGLHEGDRDRLRAVQPAAIAPLDAQRGRGARDGVGLVVPAPHARQRRPPEDLDARDLRHGDELGSGRPARDAIDDRPVTSDLARTASTHAGIAHPARQQGSTRRRQDRRARARLA